MKRTLVGLFVTVGIGVLATPAMAQRRGGAQPAPAAGGNGEVRYQAKTNYDFDDDVVEGDLVRPDGEFIDTRKQAKHSSLIKIRQDFIPEMLKSAENIF